MTWGAIGAAAVTTVGGAIASSHHSSSGGQTPGQYYPGGYFERDPAIGDMMSDWYAKYSGGTMHNNEQKRIAQNALSKAMRVYAAYKSRANSAMTDAGRQNWQKKADAAERTLRAKQAQVDTFGGNPFLKNVQSYNHGIADQYNNLQNDLRNQTYGQDYRNTLTNLIDNPGNSTGIGLPGTGYQGLLDRLSQPSNIGFGDDPNAFSFLAPGNASALKSTYNAQSGILGQLANLANERAQSGYSDVYDPSLLGIKTAQKYSPENAFFTDLNYGKNLWQPVETSRLTHPYQPVVSGATNNGINSSEPSSNEIMGRGISSNSSNIVDALTRLFGGNQSGNGAGIELQSPESPNIAPPAYSYQDFLRN